MKAIIAALICAVSIFASSLVMSKGMTKIVRDRSVTVRGLSEREVDADMAEWKLSFSIGGNDLPELQNEIIKSTKIVIEYLKSYGMDESDYTVLAPEITDIAMNAYLDNRDRRYRYIAKPAILVRCGKVQQVRKASENTLELIGKGISVNTEYGTHVNYVFNGLNDIKPAMIEEATKNAREAAEKFARDSGSRVGKIQSATQGLFSIDDAATGMEYKKTVRVVTTVVYGLSD